MEPPIKTTHLFPILDRLLIDLLRSLTEAEWHCPTIAKQWKVKDIAAHLLDGNMRTLSMGRDAYFGETPGPIHSYPDLVAYLDKLNSDWVKAAKRLSPQVLIELLTITGKQYCEHIATKNLFDKAPFSVAWAGEQESKMWFHIAREYTEKFIHQQQIRHAVGKEALLTKELFNPFIDTFMEGLPHTYRNTVSATNTIIQITVTTDIGGDWFLVKSEDSWQLTKETNGQPAAHVLIAPVTAWKLFSKGMGVEEAKQTIIITGDITLGEVALNMVSVMA